MLCAQHNATGVGRVATEQMIDIQLLFPKNRIVAAQQVFALRRIARDSAQRFPAFGRPPLRSK